MSGDNLYESPKGVRMCRTCAKLRQSGKVEPIKAEGRTCPQGHTVAGDNMRKVGPRTVCVACTNAAATRSRRRIRDLALSKYGGKCACCGETQDEFLTFDHVNNDGNEWRRQTGIRGSYAMCRWLRDNGWPTDYQILCFNCNVGKHINGGICPHQKAR